MCCTVPCTQSPTYSSFLYLCFLHPFAGFTWKMAGGGHIHRRVWWPVGVLYGRLSDMLAGIVLSLSAGISIDECKYLWEEGHDYSFKMLSHLWKSNEVNILPPPPPIIQAHYFRILTFWLPATSPKTMSHTQTQHFQLVRHSDPNEVQYLASKPTFRPFGLETANTPPPPGSWTKLTDKQWLGSTPTCCGPR